MVKLINIYTGTEMYVAEERMQEYLDAGHKEVLKIVPAKRPEKKTVKKRSTRK